MSAITRDLSRLARRAVGLAVDDGDPLPVPSLLRPCYAPVVSLLAPCSEWPFQEQKVLESPWNLGPVVLEEPGLGILPCYFPCYQEFTRARSRRSENGSMHENTAQPRLLTA